MAKAKTTALKEPETEKQPTAERVETGASTKKSQTKKKTTSKKKTTARRPARKKVAKKVAKLDKLKEKQTELESSENGPATYDEVKKAIGRPTIFNKEKADMIYDH